MHRKRPKKGDFNSNYLWIMDNFFLLVCFFLFETLILFGN